MFSKQALKMFDASVSVHEVWILMERAQSTLKILNQITGEFFVGFFSI